MNDLPATPDPSRPFNTVMPRSLKILIAEDNPLIAQALEGMVRTLHPEWELMGTASDNRALQWSIETGMPDVILLDLHMPKGAAGSLGSMHVLGRLSYQPAVIVVTGDPSQALAAFDHAVIDYLVKPVTPARLRRALSRAAQSLLEADPQPRHRTLPANGEARTWLSAQRGDDILIVQPADILYLQADRRNTRVMLADGEAVLRCGISEIERGLTHWYLLRVHRGTIVNLQHVERVRRDECGRLRIHLIGCADRPVVSRPFEAHFRNSMLDISTRAPVESLTAVEA